MRTLLFFLLLFFCVTSFSQSKGKIENLILVTIDGCRWQEVFRGADSSLLFNEKYRKTEAGRLTSKFWDADVNKRREKLFPFLWNTIAKQGRLYGNRDLNSAFSVRNQTNISYPGYAEIFTGYADTAIKNNEMVYNKNTNVFEFLNQQKTLKGKVASFASWNRANGYLNIKSSSFFINGGYEDVKGNNLSVMQQTLNNLQQNYVSWEHSRADHITYLQAKEYLRINKPRVLSIGFAWTDDMAHDGSYPNYLEKVYIMDNMIQDLWGYVQTVPQYKNKTALLVIVDHGRGLADEWRSHGPNTKHANETWLAVIAPGISPAGEMRNTKTYYNDQLAQTIAKMLGYTFTAKHPVGEAIDELIK